MGHDYCHRHECLCYRGCPDCNPDVKEPAALSASPSPVGDRDALIERLQQIHDEQRSILGQMLLDKSEEGQRASNWQGGKVNGIASAIAALAAKEQQP